MLGGPLTYEDDAAGQPLVDDSGHRWAVTLAPTVVGGRYVYADISVASRDDPPQPITRAVLRWVPLQDLIRRDTETRLNMAAYLAENSLVADVRSKARTELHEARATRRGGYLPDHWREVATVYRNAESNPTETVRGYLELMTGDKVSHSTAASHVWRARNNIDPETGKPYLEGRS